MTGLLLRIVILTVGVLLNRDFLLFLDFFLPLLVVLALDEDVGFDGEPLI